MGTPGEAETEAGAGETSKTSTHANEDVTTPTFRDFTLDSSKVLSPPAGERTKTDTAFGDGGTIAYINEDGELVMMMKYLDVGTTGMVTAAGALSEYPFPEATLVAVLGEQLNATTAGIGPHPYHYIEDARPNPFTIVGRGYRSPCYVVESLSDEPQELVFRIDMDIGMRPTSHPRQPYDVYDISDMTLESHPDDPVVRRKGEPKPKPGFDPSPPLIGELVLSFALFEDAKAVNSEFESGDTLGYHALKLNPNQTQELTAKYHMGAEESKLYPI